MAKIVEYLDPIKLVYTTDYSEMKVGYEFRVNSEPELIEINPIVFDEEPTAADLNALDDECRIAVRETGAYILCIESDYYGRSSADVGVNLWPCYVSEIAKLTLRYSKNISSVMTVTGERYPYLCAYKVASDGKGLRLARCGDLTARPDAGFGDKYYNSETMYPGEYVEFAEESSEDEEITETTVIKAGTYKFIDEPEAAAFFEIALPISVGDVDYAYLVNDVSADDSSMLKLYYLNSANDCVLAYSSEAGEDITQGWQTDDLKIFTVKLDTEVKASDGTWFDASTEVYTDEDAGDGEEGDEETSSTMLIKAGTYRWNDTVPVMYADASSKFTIPISFTTTATISDEKYVVYCDAIILDWYQDVTNVPRVCYNMVGSSPSHTELTNGYLTAYFDGLLFATLFGTDIQYITVEKDTEVIEIFGTYFNENTELVTTEANPPTAESVKAKIKSLIAKANSTTGKSDTDLTNAVKSLVAGYGQGGSTECSGEHVIPVTELPTENIVDGAMYKLTATSTICTDAALGDTVPSAHAFYAQQGMLFDIFTVDELPTANIKETVLNTQVYFYYVISENVLYKYYDGAWVSATDEGWTPIFTVKNCDGYYKYGEEFKDILIVQNSTAQSLVDEYTNYGIAFELYYVKTRPTENIKAFDDTTFYFYYVEDENDILVYGPFNDDGTNAWGSFITLMEATNGGAITDASEATTNGAVYALVENGFKEYLAPSGNITITEKGSFDVTDKAIVTVDYVVNDWAISGVWRLSTATMDIGTDVEQDVNFTVSISVNNNITYNKMVFRTGYPWGDPYYLDYDDTTVFSSITGWISETVSLVDFGDEPQLVSSDFKNLMLSIGTPVPPVSTVASISDLPTDASDGDLVIVLGGE